MKLNFTLLAFFFCFFMIFKSSESLAQSNTKRNTLSGYIKDQQTGESLIGAYIYELGNKSVGTSTNLYGFYSLSVDPGTYTIEASFIGYEPQKFEVELTEDLSLNIELIPSGIMLDQEVIVSAKRKDENVESTDMGKVELSIDKIKALPAFMGEVDIVRTLQLLPGVMSAGEANSGFYVRGGGPDQNLVLLDEAVVYNTGHLFGFFSVFNSDAIKNTTLHKGSMPAEYGGRLSSVLDVTMKEGNNKRFQADGGIGIISSRLTLQGPLQKNKSSFLISGRRTYADILARPFLKGTDFEGNGYYFYDLNLKANYQFSDKDRLYLSGYFGRDVFNFKSTDGFEFKMPWGNTTTTLRWNHLFSNKLFMNATAIYNEYDFSTEASYTDFSSDFFSGVKDWNGKLDFDFYPNVNNSIKFGLNYTFHTFTPYSVKATIGDTDIETDDLNKQKAHEAAIYIQDDITISTKLKAHIGLRASYFQQVGPYISPVYSDNGSVIDSIVYDKGDKIAEYAGLEPRIGLRYAINNRISIKAGFTMTNQYIHLVSNSTSTLPTDLWVPSTDKVKPQKAMQYSLGYFQNFFDDQYEGSVEVYYKDMRNQIEFSDFYVPELNREIQADFVFGKGRSYGLELFLKKRLGDFSGWIGYTLSRTERIFPDVDNGNVFPAKYDRTNDLSIVGVYELSNKWTISGTFVYGTGQALTLPNSFFVIGGWVYTDYDMPRNSYRLKPYHRLDFSATYKLGKKENKKFKSELVMSVYNIYNRKNPFFVYALPEQGEESGEIDIKLKQVSLFPVIPSLSWNFSF